MNAIYMNLLGKEILSISVITNMNILLMMNGSGLVAKLHYNNDEIKVFYYASERRMTLSIQF